jgi:ssDNA-specific exonuclease RecJ
MPEGFLIILEEVLIIQGKRILKSSEIYRHEKQVVDVRLQCIFSKLRRSILSNFGTSCPAISTVSSAIF